MSFVIVSSKGQLVLPAPVRKRLGLGAGSRLELTEEADGLRLRVARAVPLVDVAGLAGMVKAASQGRARRLEEFDAAQLLADKPVRGRRP